MKESVEGNRKLEGNEISVLYQTSINDMKKFVENPSESTLEEMITSERSYCNRVFYCSKCEFALGKPKTCIWNKLLWKNKALPQDIFKNIWEWDNRTEDCPEECIAVIVLDVMEFLVQIEEL